MNVLNENSILKTLFLVLYYIFFVFLKKQHFQMILSLFLFFFFLFYSDIGLTLNNSI